MRLTGPRPQLHPVHPPQLPLLLCNLTQPLDSFAWESEGWKVDSPEPQGPPPLLPHLGRLRRGKAGAETQGQSGIRQPCGLSVCEKLGTFEDNRREGSVGRGCGSSRSLGKGVLTHLLPLDDEW